MRNAVSWVASLAIAGWIGHSAYQLHGLTGWAISLPFCAWLGSASYHWSKRA